MGPNARIMGRQISDHLIEDGMAEEDWQDGIATARIGDRCQLVGDDLTTNGSAFRRNPRGAANAS